MKNCYIVHARRTPIGKIGGKLKHTRVDDLLSILLKEFKEKELFDLKEVDDCIIGCANQAGEDNRNLARMSLLLASYPHEVPGVTINRLCASGLDAIISGVGRISAGLGHLMLVGGAENMTRAPYVLSKSSKPFGRDQHIYDTSLGWRFPNPKMQKLFPLYSMGETAEEVAKKLKISRSDQDEFAYQSHQKALRAIRENKFENEICPVQVPVQHPKGDLEWMKKDEGPREDTSIETLNKLKAVFREDGTVTAGNSSSLNDGAALLLLASEEAVKNHKLTPIARIRAAGVRGVHPNLMGLGPVAATKKMLQDFPDENLDLYDAIELNEAFAAQALGCIRELNIEHSKVNQWGGAIALGHPLGQSGARIVTTLIHILKSMPSQKSHPRRGLASMCIGVGQGAALALEV